MIIHPEIIRTITERANAIIKREGYAISIPESEVKIVLEAYGEIYEESHQEKTKPKGNSCRPTTQG